MIRRHQKLLVQAKVVRFASTSDKPSKLFRDSQRKKVLSIYRQEGIKVFGSPAKLSA